MKKLVLILGMAGALLAQNTLDYGGRIVVGGVNVIGTVGGTNTFTATASPAIPAYSASVTYCGSFTNANTGASTLNINGLGAISIVKYAATALASGDIAAGKSHCVLYDGSNFVIDHVDNSPAGTGTVTNVATGCGLTGGAITTTGTISQLNTITVKTTSYPIVSGDMCNTLDMNSTSSQTFTLPQAGTTGFETGKFLRLRNINTGPTTVSTTTSNFIGGGYAAATSLVLYPNQAVYLLSDNTNWNVVQGTIFQVYEARTTVNNAASPYTVVGTDGVIDCDATAGAVTLNLPAATGTHREIAFKKTDSSANACTVTRAGSDTIDGATTVALSNQYAVTRIYDAASTVWERMHSIPVGSIVGLGTGVGTFLGTPSGANLASALTTALPNTKGGTGGDSSAATGIAHVATGTWSYSTIATADIANNAVTSAKEAVVNTRRVCDVGVGDTSGSAITNGQLGPQKRVCYVPAAATVVEMDVAADGGTPNVIVGVNHAGSVSNIVSAALATAASGGIACSNAGGTTGIDGATTCSATLQNTSVAAGDYLELVSGTAGGTAKWMTIHVIYTIN